MFVSRSFRACGTDSRCFSAGSLDFVLFVQFRACFVVISCLWDGFSLLFGGFSVVLCLFVQFRVCFVVISRLWILAAFRRVFGSFMLFRAVSCLFRGHFVPVGRILAAFRRVFASLGLFRAVSCLFRGHFVPVGRILAAFRRVFGNFVRVRAILRLPLAACLSPASRCLSPASRWPLARLSLDRVSFLHLGQSLACLSLVSWSCSAYCIDYGWRSASFGIFSFFFGFFSQIQRILKNRSA